jgi:hypothetical protein
MGGVVAIAHVPRHLDREGSEIDGGRRRLEPSVVSEAAADQARQGRAIVGDRHHLRDGEEIRHRNGDVAPQLLARQGLKDRTP